MQRNPYELEIDARYARERVAAMVETTRRTPRATPVRRAAPSPPVAWLLGGVGRALIVVGERLAGVATRRPAPVR